MALEIQPLEETDLPEFARIHVEAFDGALAEYLTPDPEGAKPHLAAGQRKSLLEDPAVRFLKVVDTQSGQIIACAKWYRYDKARSEEEVAESIAAPPVPPGSHPEAWNDLFGWLQEARAKYKGGKRCWCEFAFVSRWYALPLAWLPQLTRQVTDLSTLITDPAQERRGAGSMLMRWGCERADAEHLPVYLESSTMAQPLYEKFGFEQLERRYFDLAKYGGKGLEWNTAMVRPAK
jgi:ribosomal protein S18 acetylase RimI-like enzyme